MYASLSWLMVPSRSRMISFIASVSYGQFRNIGDAVHGLAQVGEQREAVLPQRLLLRHHHHLVEERVDRRLQHREGFQVAGVVAALEEAIGAAGGLLQRVEQ